MVYPYMNLIIEPELLESLYWGNGYTIQHIANIFGCCDMTIWNRMKEYGISCRGRGYVVTDFTFSDRQKEIFEGCMIGDGDLVWQTHNCFFGNTDKHKDYLLWLQKQLGVEDISRITPVYRFVGAGAPYEYRLMTRVIPAIRDEHKRWYPYETSHGTCENRQPKIIPKDIELTLTKVLFWFIGDGSYDNYSGYASFRNCLIYDDWLPLSKEICKVLDVNSGVSIHKQGKDDDGIQIYRLALNRNATNKFFDMVDSLGFDIPDCYQYKFGR